MTNIIHRPDWHLPESAATPESDYLDRRRFLGRTGRAGMALAAAGSGLIPTGCRAQVMGDPLTAWIQEGEDITAGGIYPASRVAAPAPMRDITDEIVAATYNNYYEFTTDKARVWELAQDFTRYPWTLEVRGEVNNPLTLDVDELERTVPLEERVYRFRCVEAWAMCVPWTGFPLARLLERAEPTSAATHVRFLTVNRPQEMPGLAHDTWYEWPYYEGLRMDEAMNELTLVATGIYGHRLPPQHGAPVRIVTPWKYGYKSPKSIVTIEVTSERPGTFWNDLQPSEYSFLSNVEPDVPHPRWSQATERVIGTGDREETLLYNGYAEQVAHLYT